MQKYIISDSGYVLAISEHTFEDLGTVEFRVSVYMPPQQEGDLAGARLDEVALIELQADGSGPA